MYRKSFRGRDNFSRGTRSRRAPRHQGGTLNVHYSKFINKATATEDVEVFTPVHTFADFDIDPRLKANISAKGYVTPTPIQDGAIPNILKGLDVVGIANTGTGKTAAFLIPLINKIVKEPKEQVLIIVPTRELAVQINDELKEFVKGSRIRSACVYGGAPMGKQIGELRGFNSFVIGTPGRLKDFILRGMIDLSKFKTVVLDEADRMLDMGFIQDVKTMMAKMPVEKHTLFFSATMSREIEALISGFLKDPVRISVKTRDTSKNIDQDVVHTNGKDKLDILHGLLGSPEFSKVLVFGRTKHGVDKLSRALAQRGLKAESIHGNKSQSKRQQALNLFKQNHLQVLVATDVAARGLDINDVSHVINFDLPSTYEDYIHRIGRTGRGNKKGKALTLIG